MTIATARLEFAPLPAAGQWSSFALALVVHALLLAALTWGVAWRRDVASDPVEVELWAALPQQAAPPEPTPEPVVEPVTPPAQPVVTPPTVDIALEREKQRREQERLELQAQEQARLAKLEREKAQKLALEQERAQEQARKDAEKKKELANKAKQEQAAAKALEKQRQENLARLAGLAGATGSSSSTGTAQQSAGPSAGYGARIVARIKPNIVFTEEISGNPRAEVEVRTAPDGTIVGRSIVKSSGNKTWDEAVLRAIDKTEKLPRDTDGRVQPALVIGFRPKD